MKTVGGFPSLTVTSCFGSGAAYGYRLDVLVDEPDVSPLGIQGPKADKLMQRVFGEAVNDIGFSALGGLISKETHSQPRSGYSKQGGFEIYVEGFDNGMPLEPLMEKTKA